MNFGQAKYPSKSLTFIHWRRMPRLIINYEGHKGNHFNWHGYIYMDIILPCIAICCLCIIQRPPRRLGILQGLHEGWCRPGYRTSRISQGLSDLTIWTLRRSGKHEKKEMEIWNVSLFCHFFCTCVFNCPRPCRLDTKSVYSWII